MQRRTFISLVMIAVLGAAGALAHRYTIAAETAQRSAPPPSIPVVAAPVERGDVPIYLYGVGTVIAYNTVVVRSQIQGQITQINFKEGEAVHAGDQLALIDPAPYQAQVDQMVAAHDRDQAQLTNALANLDRYTTLVGKGWATQQLADTQKAQVAQLQNAVKGMRRYSGGEGPTPIHEADLVNRWGHRHSADRCRKRHPSDGPEWSRGRDPNRPDCSRSSPCLKGIYRTSSNKWPRGP